MQRRFGHLDKIKLFWLVWGRFSVHFFRGKSLSPTFFFWGGIFREVSTEFSAEFYPKFSAKKCTKNRPPGKQAQDLFCFTVIFSQLSRLAPVAPPLPSPHKKTLFCFEFYKSRVPLVSCRIFRDVFVCIVKKNRELAKPNQAYTYMDRQSCYGEIMYCCHNHFWFESS
jgi:hypothetical protein